MAKGGARPGAGRKPGSANRKTREIADRAAAEGKTPLEVMLEAMRAHYDNGALDEAATIAKDAAPYIHPRLSAVDMSAKTDNVTRVLSERPMSVDDWSATHSVGTPAGAPTRTH